MKRCINCEIEKPLDQFYKHSQMADGRLGRCKECHKAGMQAARLARAEYYKEYDDQRSITAERKEALSRSAAAYYERHPERYEAELLYRQAIYNGVLVKQPCEECGNPKVEGHHDDYSKPLEVRWLCRRCHRRLHGRQATTNEAIAPKKQVNKTSKDGTDAPKAKG